MQLFRFADAPGALPRPADPDRAAVGLERWREATARANGGGLQAFADTVAADGTGRALLEAVFGNSPFLTQCAATDPGFVCRLLTVGPDEAGAGIMNDLRIDRLAGLDGAALARCLRVAKRRVALSSAPAPPTPYARQPRLVPFISPTPTIPNGSRGWSSSAWASWVRGSSIIPATSI
jgi:hypothetical protein